MRKTKGTVPALAFFWLQPQGISYFFYKIEEPLKVFGPCRVPNLSLVLSIFNELKTYLVIISLQESEYDLNVLQFSALFYRC
jgi:hypothetical protein